MIYQDSQQEQYFVYILLCADNSYYIGLTNDMVRRLKDHEQGGYPRCFTFERRPVRLEYYETIPFLKEAVAREVQLKKWSRKKKEALIQRDYHRLRQLAQCQNLSHSQYKDLR